MLSRAAKRGFVKGVAKGIFLGLLKPYRERDLEWHIRNKTSLLGMLKEDKVLYWRVRNIIAAARELAESVDINPSSDLTVDHILIALFKTRYDLFRVLHTEEGREWLEKNFNEFKKEFLW